MPVEDLQGLQEFLLYDTLHKGESIIPVRDRRGNATVTQLVDAEAGIFTNVIQFDGTKNKVREFQVTPRSLYLIDLVTSSLAAFRIFESSRLLFKSWCAGGGFERSLQAPKFRKASGTGNGKLLTVLGTESFNRAEAFRGERRGAPLAALS